MTFIFPFPVTAVKKISTLGLPKEKRLKFFEKLNILDPEE